MSSAPESASTVSQTAPEPQPMHKQPQSTTVQPSQAPFGATNNGATAPGAGQRALLAKKMAKGSNPSIVSPTDNMMTPVSAKLSQAKKKHFAKAVKPISFGQSGLGKADDDDE